MAKLNLKRTEETVEQPVEVTAEPKKSDVNPIVRDGYDLDKLRAEYTTKSAVIRFLASKGYERGPIAKFLGIKYQFVRNVLIQAKNKAEKSAE